MSSGALSRKRTASQNIQLDKLDVQGLQQQRSQRQRQGGREVRSYKGATRAAEQAIARQQAKLPGLGLQGTPEGRQLSQEYRSRSRDLRTNLPFLVAATQRETKSDLAGINSDLQSALLALQQDRQDKAQAVADQLAEIAQNKSEKRASVDVATREALRLIREQADINASTDPQDASHKTPSAVPQNDLQWQRFFEHLRSSEGVDDRSARKAIKRIQNRVAAEVQYGSTPHSPNRYRSRPPLSSGF